jgi:ABC-type enterochelin transport system permease subunit
MTFAFTVAGLGFAYSGFAALSLAMDRHHEDVFGRGKEPSARLRNQLRGLGSFALLLSLIACVALRGATIGPVLWLGVLTAGAIALVLVLTYAPQRVVRLAQCVAAVAAAGLLVGAAVA